MVISNQAISCRTIVERFPQFFIEVHGDLSTEVRAVTSPEGATSESMIFLSTGKAFQSGIDSPAKVLVVGKKQRDEALRKRGGRILLIAQQTERAMAAVISEFFLRTPYTNNAIDGVHPTALVSPLAHISSGARVGPNAFVGAGVKIGAGSYVGANSVIEDDAVIGENTVVHPLVFIGHSCLIGSRCEIHPQSVIGKEGYGYAHDEQWNHFKIPHQGRVVLEDDVHIGACCTIDRATFTETRIERGTKLDNQIHIAHNCRIGRNSLLTAGFMMAGSSRIGANFVTGGNTVVTGHVEICDNVQLGGISVVRKNITQPGQYAGNPLQPLSHATRSLAAFAQLPELRKQVRRIMSHIGLKDE